MPSAITCDLSPLIPRIHSCLFLDWGRTVSSKFFYTEVHSISTEELVLLCLVRCVLSRLRCNGHSLMLSSNNISVKLAESRILPAAPADTRPRTPLISFCIVQLRTLCAAHSLATLCLSTTFCLGSRELPGFCSSMVFRHAPIPRKGSSNSYNNNNITTNQRRLIRDIF